MRLKKGTKIELHRDLSDSVRFAGVLDLSIFDFKKTRNGRTNGRTDGRTDPHIEIRGRI